MSSSEHTLTTLIIGAGIFGTSTAYHLSLSVPPSTITVIDRHVFPAPPAASPSAPLGASHDINKIVRADYSSPFYMTLAQEAIAAWSSWPLLKPFYHPTGWVMFDEEGSDLAARIRKNFKECGEADETRDLDFEEVRKGWGGVLADMNLEGFASAYWNPGAGWAEADKAVAAMLGEAVERGVKYLDGQVESLVLTDEKKGVKGVRLKDGRVVEADRVLMATGAWTSSILTYTEDELELERDERVENQAKAAGVVAAHFELSEEEKKLFDRMPVVVYGENGEIIPPPPSNLLKFTNARSVTNSIVEHDLSVPPQYSQDIVPEALKTETLAIIKSVMPSILSNDRPVSFWRICWDSITPTQHQLITRHPDDRLSNLYLAVGGSFHSWKFLPTVGKYVGNVIRGISNGEEKDGNWAWKRAGWRAGATKGVHDKTVPRRELKHLENIGKNSVL